MNGVRVVEQMINSILVVDDSNMSRKLVIRSLPEEWHAPIFQATNGVEALEVYHAQKPDVVFLDLTMPELDGFGVLAALREAGSTTPVIVISADVQTEAYERAINLGARAFIQKPMKPGDVKKVVRELGLL